MVGAQFVGDDAGESGFAQARRPAQQNVIHRLAAVVGRFDGNLQILFYMGLAGEFVETRRA